MAKVTPDERRKIAHARTTSLTGGYRTKAPSSSSKVSATEAAHQSGRQMKERLSEEAELGLRRGRSAFKTKK